MSNTPTIRALAIDVETTGTDPCTDRVVQLAAVGLRIDPGSSAGDAPTPLFTSLVDPGRDIPATASAIHHLTSADVQGQPRLEQALAQLQHAAQAFRPDLLVAHNAGFDAGFLPDLAVTLTPQDPRWVCTYRLAQHLWPDAPRHQLQTLRYWRHLQDRAAGRNAHQADFDALCCAVLLAEQCRVWTPANQTVTPTLLRDRSAELPLLPRVPFGRHRDQLWSDVPCDYCQWILRQHTCGHGDPFDPAIIATAEAALRGIYAIPPDQKPGDDDDGDR